MNLESLRSAVEGALDLAVAGKKHVSVRWEPGPGVCRVGVCIDEFTWANREAAIDALLSLENAYGGGVAIDFDVLPLQSVNTIGFAEV